MFDVNVPVGCSCSIGGGRGTITDVGKGLLSPTRDNQKASLKVPTPGTLKIIEFVEELNLSGE